MSLRSVTGRPIAALAGVSMLFASLNSASAFTLSGPSLEMPIASAQINKVWWRGGWGCGWGRCGGGWGWWGPRAVVGGVVAGAVVGGAIAASGPGYYGPCWRQVVGPYGGWQWQRVC